MQQPVFALRAPAPVGDAGGASMGQGSEMEKEEDEAEAGRIEDELADILNEEGVSTVFAHVSCAHAFFSVRSLGSVGAQLRYTALLLFVSDTFAPCAWLWARV